MGNLIASIIFFATGVIILYLKSVGKLDMEDVTGFIKYIMDVESYVNHLVGSNIISNLCFLVIFGLFIYSLIREVRKR